METNKAISRRDAPMIGCAAHRLHLAVQVKNHTVTIVKVSVLKRKLKSVKRIAMLTQNHCKLKPVPLHELRWSGIHGMQKRYKDLYSHIDKHISEETPANDSRRYPIVQFLPDPNVVEIMKGEEKELTSEEEDAAIRLLWPPEYPANQGASPSTTHKRMRKQQAKTGASKRTRNPNATTVNPRPQSLLSSTAASADGTVRQCRTPQEVMAAVAQRAKIESRGQIERLFSTIKCMLGYLRKRMSVETLEMILFLKLNWDLVTNEATSRAVQLAREDDVPDNEEQDSFE
ncbi:hypothetical protein GQ600_10828 [Phytophthora cactorum]|nr:hypothetical protein GQ600_10828 [Phytophthora cactorum]